MSAFNSSVLVKSKLFPFGSPDPPMQITNLYSFWPENWVRFTNGVISP